MTITRRDGQDILFATVLIGLAIWSILQRDAALLATVVLLPNLLIFAPQFILTFIHKDTDGLSLKSMFMLGTAASFFTLAGVLLPEYKMSVVNLICFSLIAAICWAMSKKAALLYLLLGIGLNTALYTYHLFFGIDANIILFVAGWMGNIGLLQQAWSIIKTGHTHGVSFKTFLLVTFVAGIWLVWAIELNIWGTILSNSVGCLTAAFICCYKLKNWRKDHP